MENYRQTHIHTQIQMVTQLYSTSSTASSSSASSASSSSSSSSSSSGSSCVPGSQSLLLNTNASLNNIRRNNTEGNSINYQVFFVRVFKFSSLDKELIETLLTWDVSHVFLMVKFIIQLLIIDLNLNICDVELGL